MLGLSRQIMALKTLEVLCNQAIKMDPAAWAQLQHLEGQSIHLHIEGSPLELCVQFSRLGIHFPVEPTQEAQTTTQVKGHMNDFLKLIRAEDKQAALANSDIEINGRSGLLLQLANIVQHLDLDWASAIQPLIGPVATQLLVKGSNNLKLSGQKTLQTFKQDVKDYLLNEQSIVPHAWEIEHFSEKVSQLRADTDRLHARIQRLQHRLSQHSSHRMTPTIHPTHSDPSSGQYPP